MRCIDASVVAQWLLAEQYSAQADALFADALATGETLIASSLLPFEVANALRKQVLRNNLAVNDARAQLARYEALPIVLHAAQGLHREAFEVAVRLNLPAVYDAGYLALAQRSNCEFWTADERLFNAVSSHLSFIRRLAVYPLPSPPTPNV